jgi:hypothetical protein
LGDEFVPHLAREGQVDERVAVEVAKLALSEAELDPAEAVRCALDARPRHHRRGNSPTDADALAHPC